MIESMEKLGDESEAATTDVIEGIRINEVIATHGPIPVINYHALLAPLGNLDVLDMNKSEAKVLMHLLTEGILDLAIFSTADWVSQAFRLADVDTRERFLTSLEKGKLRKQITNGGVLDKFIDFIENGRFSKRLNAAASRR